MSSIPKFNVNLLDQNILSEHRHSDIEYEEWYRKNFGKANTAFSEKVSAYEKLKAYNKIGDQVEFNPSDQVECNPSENDEIQRRLRTIFSSNENSPLDTKNTEHLIQNIQEKGRNSPNCIFVNVEKIVDKLSADNICSCLTELKTILNGVDEVGELNSTQLMKIVNHIMIVMSKTESSRHKDIIEFLKYFQDVMFVNISIISLKAIISKNIEPFNGDALKNCSNFIYSFYCAALKWKYAFNHSQFLTLVLNICKELLFYSADIKESQYLVCINCATHLLHKFGAKFDDHPLSLKQFFQSVWEIQTSNNLSSLIRQKLLDLMLLWAGKWSDYYPSPYFKKDNYPVSKNNFIYNKNTVYTQTDFFNFEKICKSESLHDDGAERERLVRSCSPQIVGKKSALNVKLEDLSFNHHHKKKKSKKGHLNNEIKGSGDKPITVDKKLSDPTKKKDDIAFTENTKDPCKANDPKKKSHKKKKPKKGKLLEDKNEPANQLAFNCLTIKEEILPEKMENTAEITKEESELLPTMKLLEEVNVISSDGIKENAISNFVPAEKGPVSSSDYSRSSPSNDINQCGYSPNILQCMGKNENSTVEPTKNHDRVSDFIPISYACLSNNSLFSKPRNKDTDLSKIVYPVYNFSNKSTNKNDVGNGLDLQISDKCENNSTKSCVPLVSSFLQPKIFKIPKLPEAAINNPVVHQNFDESHKTYDDHVKMLDSIYNNINSYSNNDIVCENDMLEIGTCENTHEINIDHKCETEIYKLNGIDDFKFIDILKQQTFRDFSKQSYPLYQSEESKHSLPSDQNCTARPTKFKSNSTPKEFSFSKPQNPLKLSNFEDDDFPPLFGELKSLKVKCNNNEEKQNVKKKSVAPSKTRTRSPLFFQFN